jgi:hypothetical protein
MKNLTPIEKIFPVPYFPRKQNYLASIPISAISMEWVSACIYSIDLMTERQKAFFLSLRPKKRAVNGELRSVVILIMMDILKPFIMEYIRKKE